MRRNQYFHVQQERSFHRHVNLHFFVEILYRIYVTVNNISFKCNLACKLYSCRPGDHAQDKLPGTTSKQLRVHMYLSSP